MPISTFIISIADNDAQHHQFSARFGWRWSEGALRLFGYIYNNGKVSYNEIGTIQIGTEYTCAISVTDNQYIFRLNDKVLSMPRTSKTLKAKGYKLYPYFGGDETAPHDIHIWINDQPAEGE